MKGSMMDYPLSLQAILERIPKTYPTVEIVSRLPDGGLHRYTYLDFYRRAKSLAEALHRAGLQPGDRVGTLCWNHYAHLEAYFGVPAAGGVVHTLNLRLHPQELAFIVNHAQDRFLIVDDVLLPLYEQFRDKVKAERVFVVRHENQALPPGAEGYEELLASASGGYEFPCSGENDAAAMCFTSGTTGNSKGVLYSHRALILHALAFSLPDAFCVSQHDVAMALAPMFHANAHGLPHVAIMLGCKLVLPGRQMDAPSLLDLFSSEQVTIATAVPTVWTGILEALEKDPARWKLASNFRGFVGGTAVPEALVRKLDQRGLRLIQVWGMTETTPVAVCSTLKAHMLSWPEKEQYRVRVRQGRALPFMEVRVVHDHGEAPWDGTTLGELHVRGPWAAASYFNAPGTEDRWTADGWLRTGDIATIDAEGYVQIADRAKDLIKSGGEWISSVDLENALVAHAAVREAGVIAVPHPKWDERPVAVVVLRPGATATPDELREFLASRFAKWQLPDAFVFLDELPHTSTGKLSKLELRKRFADWQWEKSDAKQ
ncbi:MAG TPA: long-chain fatty acid--CoA ligase [Alphaproteobacteria bacterium]|nr:long-chain fatty acid--CoA ligase [Alphaproteobacteria bacterium]